MWMLELAPGGLLFCESLRPRCRAQRAPQGQTTTRRTPHATHLGERVLVELERAQEGGRAVVRGQRVGEVGVWWGVVCVDAGGCDVGVEGRMRAARAH